jgi:hypothetical protein
MHQKFIDLSHQMAMIDYGFDVAQIIRYMASLQCAPFL